VYVDTSVNDAVSNKHYTASNDWLKLNNELERTRKEAAMAKFTKLRRYLPENEKNHEIRQL
jgi:hypothetical protein